MFVISKRNIIIPSPDGKTSCFIPKDYIGSIPEWAAETAYFCELVKEGKLSVSESKKDKDIEKAAEKPVVDHAREKEEEKPKKKMTKAKITY